MVPYTILTDRAQRAHNWWRKMPYISVLWKYLPECRVIKNMHKKLNSWGHPLAIASNCSIASSADRFPARSCLVCTLFPYIMLHILTQRHKLDQHIWNLLMMSFQMRYNLIILNNSNYQTLTQDLYQPELANTVYTANLSPFCWVHCCVESGTSSLKSLHYAYILFYIVFYIVFAGLEQKSTLVKFVHRLVVALIYIVIIVTFPISLWFVIKVKRQHFSLPVVGKYDLYCSLRCKIEVTNDAN